MMRYLTVNEVIVFHEYLIDEFGGSGGMRDLAALESVLARPQSGHYKNIMEESSALELLSINDYFNIHQHAWTIGSIAGEYRDESIKEIPADTLVSTLSLDFLGHPAQGLVNKIGMNCL